ncbi:MAG: biotin attachment protein [bacterium]|nr:biotin attachment protein [bacterium]
MITAFRDGFQSVFGARVFTKDFLPAVEATRAAGIDHFEAGGGARFQSLYFYCNEDAFDMMDAFRKKAGKDANLQTLARGINVVGLDSQSSDVINLHAQLFKKHGITTIRNFDALNDVNNLIYSGQCIHDAGLKHEVVITMMSLPPACSKSKAHTSAFYTDTLRKILDAGIPYDSVCFKDASGTCAPTIVFDTMQSARKLLGDNIEIRFHSHDTAGTGSLCYMAAIRGGANALDLSMAPVSAGTCQPDVLTMWHALRWSDYTLDIDVAGMREAEEVFKECMQDYFVPPESRSVEPLIPFSPMPGGALTANTQMMRDNNIMDKYPEVIKAMGEVVERGGFGTSVTPVSQFYFQQAFNNVMFGPWKKFAEGYGKMVLGYFGKTPMPPDEEIVKMASGQLGLEPTTESPLAINDRDPKKGLGAARKMLQAARIVESDENLFIAATCKEKGIAFLKGEAKIGVRKNPKKGPDKAEGYTVAINGKPYSVILNSDGEAIVNGMRYNIDVTEGISEKGAVPADISKAGTRDARGIKAPLPGAVVRVNAKVSDHLEKGDTIMVLEAMKMETEIKAPISGTLTSIAVSSGEQVNSGQTLAWIN